MKSLPIAFAALLICSIAAAQSDDDKLEKKDSGLTVVVRLSGEEYDPAKPAGTITCLVLNKSDEDIVLPAEYDGATIVLYGNRLHLWRRDRPAKERASERLTIAPGKEQQLFELSLAEILAPQRGQKGPEGKWGWDWSRRPEPPQSPIHNWRKPGYEESARFFVEIETNHGKAASEPVTLKVTGAGEATK